MRDALSSSFNGFLVLLPSFVGARPQQQQQQQQQQQHHVDSGRWSQPRASLSSYDVSLDFE